MKEIEFDVVLKVRDLYAFTMRHTYLSVSGIFSLVISVGCFLVCMSGLGSFETTTIAALLVIASLFTIVQPLLLYIKCSAQIKKNDNINAPLHYVLAEEEITVRQGEQEGVVKWYDVRRAIRAKRGMYLYMSPVRAFIFPKEQCGSLYPEICSTVIEQMEKYKDYVPTEEEMEEKHE